MSIKKLFDSNKPQNVIINTSLEEEIVKKAPELESADNVRQQIKRINRFIPQVDFSDPNNFVVYGLAKSYYEDSMSRIWREFPYDGSEEEITRFHNDSNYLDLYLFDKRYPRTTGYAIFSSNGWGTAGTPIQGWGSSSIPEYISFFGGPNTASNGMEAGTLHTNFTGSNYYDTDIYTTDGTLPLDRVGTRESNLKFDLSNGITTEFWLKKDSWVSASTEKEVLFDLWNGATTSSADYGRFLLYMTASTDGSEPLRLHMGSGSVAVDLELASSDITTGSIADGLWHHYAVTVLSGSGGLTTKMYIDGTLNKTQTSAVNFGEVTGSLIGFMGALQTSPSGSVYDGEVMVGYAKLTGSIDEFRYWKSKRDEKDIQYNWWTQVRGGTNEKISNAELGVYYKFNEGITGTSSVDSIVLDYSGRITNGTWVGYPGSSARSTGSAINSSTMVVSGTTEYQDPIIYSFHPDVLSLYDELSTSGSVYDDENNASILDSIPAWIIEEDEYKGTKQLKNLTQIIGSYFDSLNSKIKVLPELAELSYVSASAKPTPFNRNLLSARGLAVPDIFVDAELLEYFANRRQDRKYDIDITEVKNLIYKNIYNNLTYLYKAKGTQKAFRNILHCYGIGEEIIKFNAYGNNTTFTFEDTDYEAVTRKNYIDFNNTDRFDGIVYQNSSSANLTNTSDVTYISGTSGVFANTAEIEVIFPKKFAFENSQYFDTPFVTASIFGHHAAAADPTNFGFVSTANDKNFQLYFVKTEKNSKDGYFLLKDRAGNFELTSSVYSNVYDNQKWNFGIKIKDKFWPYSSGITGSNVNNDLELEWYGVNVELGVIKNEFTLTASSLDNSYLSNRRRYYAGSDRTNYTGSVITQTDVRVTSVRHWATYLENSVIVEHAKDPDNIGTLNPSKNAIFAVDVGAYGIDNVYFPQAATLALNWDFSQITGSDSNGEFTVEDASSGSVELRTRYPNTAYLSNIVANQYAGRGYFPNAVSSISVVNKDYIAVAKQRLPEVVNSNDAVNILTRDDDLYPRERAISQVFFSFEKSMYGIISQEMINMFATITDFNNLIGNIANKYRNKYKDLDVLRNLFFEKIQNDPDLDKFIDYYKWIDSSIIIFLQQFVPASANVSDEIRTMVEDHILGRNKYRHQYPMLDYKGNDRWGGDETKLEAIVKTNDELLYNWKFGHAPLNNEQSSSGRWWKERAERTNSTFGTTSTIDSARQTITDIILSFNSASAEIFNNGSGEGGTYSGSTYAIRQFANRSKISTFIDRQIGGGYNYNKFIKPDAVYSVIKRGSASSQLTVSKGTFKDVVIEEVGPPSLQTKRQHDSQLATDSNNTNGYSTAKEIVPYTAFSSSAGNTGYRSQTNGIELAGYHNDSVGEDYDIPMQGPFTQMHVGGHRHRHTDLTIDPTLTSSANRAEAWNYNSNVFSANDANYNKPSTSPQYNEGAKQPINIKNIQHRTGSSTISMGNFNKTYEVVNTNSRRTNNSAFVKQEGFSTASITSDVTGYIYGLIDYAKPIRGRTEHVIVNRFSAPGSPETAGDANGGAGLDYESAEISPYNNLNYRNLTIRQPLQSLLTEKSEQFGLRSGSSVSELDYSSVTASYHKINRNGLKRIESGSSGYFTASVYDNYYVQHVIPQSDFQYAWITESYDSTETLIYGYLPYNGYVSTSAGFVGAINFVTGSDITTNGIFVDFVNLNTLITEPVSSSTQILGYPLETTVDSYANSEFGTLANSEILNSLINHRGGPFGYSTWKQIRIGQGQLGRYLRNNNLYSHTPEGTEDIIVNLANNGTTTIRPRYGESIIATQSVVTSKYHPVVHELIVRTGKDKRGNDKTSTIVVQSSFANNQIKFENKALSDSLNLKESFKDSAYKQLLKNYQGEELNDPSNPIVGIGYIKYKETVYPATDNMYTSNIRGRTNYDNNFWRDSRTDRTTKGADKKPTNSMGKTVSQSSWALDADESFTTNTSNPTGGIDANNTDGFNPGELQNKYAHFVQRQPDDDTGTVPVGQFRIGTLYARKHVMPYTGSVAPAWGMRDSITIDNFVAVSYNNYSILRKNAIGSGEAHWDAPILSGKYTGTGSVFTTSSRNPFYDNYSSYFADIRSKGNNYSIVPEFRITEHLDFYETSNDFLKENNKFLTIAGTPSGSSIPQNSDEDNFFKIFTNSDFMKYFEIIEKDHKGYNDPVAITMKCKAIKKFIPYDGFFPSERTVEIASQFSKSVGPYLNIFGPSAAALRPHLKPFFAPGILYNTIKSGIAVDYPIMTGSYLTRPLYNSSSADYAAERYATTASYCIFSNSRSSSYDGTDSTISFNPGGRDHNNGWDYRIPFEALVEPERYLSNRPIYEDEPTEFTNSSVSASWTGQLKDNKYKKMMHNFLAETMNFFIDKGKPTEILSAPQEEFLDMTLGQPYGMRIKIYRSLENPNVSSGSWGDYPIPQYISGSAKTNFEMYSRPSAFGPPVATRRNVDGAAIENAITGSNEFSPANGIYASHTPPYYDGEAWIDVIFYPWATLETGSNSYKNDIFKPTLKDLHTKAKIPRVIGTKAQPDGYQSRIGNFGTYIRTWRFDQEALSYVSDSSYWQTGSNFGPMAGPWANNWAMQGDASLNIFEKTNDGRWKIQTKFETPMLNFKYLTEEDITLPTEGKATVPRGMWHQFGRLPRENEGVYIQVTDIPDNWLDNHPSGTVIFDPSGQFSKSNRYANTTDQPTLNEGATALNGYKLPIDLRTVLVDGDGRYTSPSPLSLVDICKFSTDPVRVGEVKTGKKVSEAIVAIPFYEEQGERKFFKLVDTRSALFNEASGDSIKRQVSLMNKYIFPPSLDFVKYPETVQPIAMYIFEFNHTFKKDDLSHMWQNLMPNIGTRAAASTATITHPLLANEIIGDSNDSLNSVTNGTSFNNTGIKKNLQWMVFKVKQRAKTDYFTQIGSKKKSNITSDYTYNWPYDFFSLVELAQIDAEVQFSGRISENSKKIKTEINRGSGRQQVISNLTAGTAGSEDIITNINDVQGLQMAPPQSNVITDGKSPPKPGFNIRTGIGAIDTEFSQPETQGQNPTNTTQNGTINPGSN